MLNLILFDEPSLHLALSPLALTRPIAAFRMGIDTLAQKWEFYLGCQTSFLVAPYLSAKYPCQYQNQNLYINSSLVATESLAQICASLGENEALFEGDKLLSFCSKEALSYGFSPDSLNINKKLIYENTVSISQLSDLFVYNGKQIVTDFQRITSTLNSVAVHDSFTVLYNKEQIFFGQNVSCKAAILDASQGPIFIDDNASLEIGALIQGPAYIGKNSIVALGAKIRPNTSIGPYCKIGGEVGMSIMFGYSNKGHDGFMGCAVIGEWCNWGAATNNSNLKNDFGTVSMYHYGSQSFEDTGELFAGLIMADYSKTAIGTCLNTGTVVGVCCNVMAAGFPERHIPSFTWGGGKNDSQPYRLTKALEVIEKTMARRQQQLTEADSSILTHIFNLSQQASY